MSEVTVVATTNGADPFDYSVYGTNLPLNVIHIDYNEANQSTESALEYVDLILSADLLDSTKIHYIKEILYKY